MHLRTNYRLYVLMYIVCVYHDRKAICGSKDNAICTLAMYVDSQAATTLRHNLVAQPESILT